MADNQPGGTPGQQPGEGGMPEPQQITFDSWLTGQDESIQGLVNGHINGLKSALDSERAQRKELAGALREAAKNAGNDADTKKRLEEISGKLEGYAHQMAFYETAQAAGVSNLKLAWLAAREADAIRKDGTVDIERLKASYPELFTTRTPLPLGNAGNGSNGARPPAGKRSFDDIIRQSIGVTKGE